MKYTTSYTSSNGQPRNGHKIHENLNAALAAWAANIGGLIQCSGGDSTLKAWEDDDLDSVYAEADSSISWLEHFEGGFVIAGGTWLDEVAHLARHASENGATLTAEELVRRLSE